MPATVAITASTSWPDFRNALRRVSGNLHQRIFQHKFHPIEGFTAKYRVTRRLYWESYDDVYKELAREQQLKGWSRAEKTALRRDRNPPWADLAAAWYSLDAGRG